MVEYSDFIAIYFTEEKIQLLFVIILGIMSILLASTFLFIIKYSFFKGLAIPLLLIGVIQLTAGIIVYNRTPKDLERVQQFVKQSNDNIKTIELPRIEKVIQDFVIYKWIEVILIITGMILWVIFKDSYQTFWKGLALGLLIQASVMLSLDLVAEKRAKNYFIELQLIK